MRTAQAIRGLETGGWSFFEGCDTLFPSVNEEFRGDFVVRERTSVMITTKPQPISGVSSGYENIVEELYPSMAMTGLGQFLNQLYESIPVKINGVKLSYLLFVLPTIPLALLAYFLMKIGGSRYVVTNRAVKRVSSLGYRLLQEAPLDQIAQVTVDPDSRLSFFRTGDVRLTNAGGDTLLLLRGVPYPERFQQVILEARDARKYVAASLAAINQRR